MMKVIPTLDCPHSVSHPRCPSRTEKLSSLDDGSVTSDPRPESFISWWFRVEPYSSPFAPVSLFSIAIASCQVPKCLYLLQIFCTSLLWNCRGMGFRQGSESRPPWVWSNADDRLRISRNFTFGSWLSTHKVASRRPSLSRAECTHYCSTVQCATLTWTNSIHLWLIHLCLYGTQSRIDTLASSKAKRDREVQETCCFCRSRRASIGGTQSVWSSL